MPVAVLTLRFDAQTDTLVRLQWEVLAKEGIGEAAPPRHRPHVTISAYEVDDLGPLCAALPDFTRSISAFPMRFHAIGIFPETGTVFLAPHITQPLLSLQADLLQYLSPHCGSPAHPEHLLPGSWMPHCTLATRLATDDVPRAVHICQRRWTPLKGMVEAIGILILPEKKDRCEGALVGH